MELKELELGVSFAPPTDEGTGGWLAIVKLPPRAKDRFVESPAAIVATIAPDECDELRNGRKVEDWSDHAHGLAWLFVAAPKLARVCERLAEAMKRGSELQRAVDQADPELKAELCTALEISLGL